MTTPVPPAPQDSGAPPSRDERLRILEIADRLGVKFLRLQFTDILGVVKNVEVPDKQFDAALDGQIMFDGSSIEGFVRIEESDMYLRPDLATFRVFPWTHGGGEKVARVICDIHNPDGSPSRVWKRKNSASGPAIITKPRAWAAAITRLSV